MSIPLWKSPVLRELFIETGEFRCPKTGELFCSGAQHLDEASSIFVANYKHEKACSPRWIVKHNNKEV